MSRLERLGRRLQRLEKENQIECKNNTQVRVLCSGGLTMRQRRCPAKRRQCGRTDYIERDAYC